MACGGQGLRTIADGRYDCRSTPAKYLAVKLADATGKSVSVRRWFCCHDALCAGPGVA